MSALNRPGYRRTSFLTPIIKTFIIINVSVWLFQSFFLVIISDSLLSYFIGYFALWPIDSFATFDQWITMDPGIFYPWQIITYQFMHSASNIFHIIFNMIILWMFGSELEGLWGSGKFLGYYILAGIGAALVQLFIAPMLGQVGPTVGASGAVYGILIAFIMTFPDRPIFFIFFPVPIPAKYLAIILGGFELIMGFTGGDGIAHFAHLGGAATGFLLMKYGDKMNIYSMFNKMMSSKPKQRTDTSSFFGQQQRQSQQQTRFYKPNWHQQQQQPKHTTYTEADSKPSKYNLSVDGEEITQAKIDAILDKISESGYQNLSEKEKKILFELSKKL